MQGYAYDARIRAAELADRVWDDPDLAIRLRESAGALRDRFDEAFWVEERGTYALALDGDKQRVDSLCSNLGHLLWSGIVPPSRLDQVAAALAGPELWTGWGVRTMGAAEAAYNPLSYHNGTVWPHDTALAAWGLARAGYTDLAQLFSLSLIEAAASLDYSCPRYSRATSASRRRFPSPIRPPPGRRRGPPERPCSASRCSSACARIPPPASSRPRPLGRPTGSKERGSRGSEPSAASGRWRLGTGPSW